MRDDLARLLDIQEAIARIGQYTAKGRDAFDRDELIQTWVLHHLQIIGEAAGKLTAEFRAQHPEVDWSRIIGTRNILVHHYFGIDKDVVWEVVRHDLPDLESQVASFIDGLQGGSGR
jgi:uncharacterized protein with HEPN domain